ncbi:MAG: AcrR family transcriptional regulator [Bermanella sp.]|jgi:AcrR family transcriptional regulator
MVDEDSDTDKPRLNPRLRPMVKGSPRVQRRRLRVQESLRAAAREVLEEKGWAGCGTQEILDAADLSRATLYNHYPSKDALIAELLEELIEQLMDDTSRLKLIKPSEPVSIKEAVFDTYNRMFSMIKRERRLLAAMAVGIRVSEELSELWRGLEALSVERVANDLKIAAKAGVLRHGADIKTVSLVIASLNDSMIISAVLQEELEVEVVATVMTQIYWDTVYRSDGGPQDYIVMPGGGIKLVEVGGSEST